MFCEESTTLTEKTIDILYWAGENETRFHWSECEWQIKKESQWDKIMLCYTNFSLNYCNGLNISKERKSLAVEGGHEYREL